MSDVLSHLDSTSTKASHTLALLTHYTCNSQIKNI